MKTLINVHQRFHEMWPYTVEHFVRLLREKGEEVRVVLVPWEDARFVSKTFDFTQDVERLVSLQVPMSVECLDAFPLLREFVYETPDNVPIPRQFAELLSERGVRTYKHKNEGMWGQSVAEFALALMLCGLRRIPQLHHDIICGRSDWRYLPTVSNSGQEGCQFGDDDRFTNGTLRGKQVRIVGAGNVGSRVARFAVELGASVSTWDPFASDPCFHLANSKREASLERLVEDAEIFLPLLPLTTRTYNIVTAEHLYHLPRGTLVVLATRAQICHMATIRRRVLEDELALAADVFDLEPLPATDCLIGRHNVIHTPHIAGRTRDANEQYAASLVAQFIGR